MRRRSSCEGPAHHARSELGCRRATYQRGVAGRAVGMYYTAGEGVNAGDLSIRLFREPAARDLGRSKVNGEDAFPFQ
jgi:hypothetical protein